MYVVIIGGGRIGRHIARDMVDRHNQVAVIEQHASRCERLAIETDILVIEGDAGDVEILRQAKVDRADVFVATTHSDEDNLVACELARVEFGVQRAISRVNSPKNVEIFETLGIEAVSSTRLLSELLESEFTVDELVRQTLLRDGRLVMLEVQVPDGTTHADDDGTVLRAPAERRIEDLDLPLDAVVAAIFRGSETLVPRGGMTIRPGDELVVVATPDVEDRVRAVVVGAP